MRVLGYFRVSDERQVDGYSLDAQERAYVAWVTQNQHQDIGRFRDEGRSAFRNSLERPDFQRALHLVRTRQVDAVWVHRSSRFSRDDSVSDDLLDQFERLGVKLVVDHTTIDRSTPHGWLGHKVNSIFDEAYSRFVSFKVKKGLREKAEQGRWVGPLPLGYTKDADGNLIPSADADAVRLIFQLYADGQHSYTTVADELNRLGWRTLDWRTKERRLFGRESVRTILHNRAYIGAVSSAGVEYLGKHPPLISSEMWESVQRLMAERTSWHGTPVTTSDAWLMGRLWCDTCGRKIWHQLSGRSGRVRYYRCSGYSNRVCDQAPLIPAVQLEDQVLALIGQLTIPPTLLEQVLSDTERYLASLSQPLTRTIDRSAIEGKLRRLARLYEDGLKTDAEYERERNALRTQLDTATTSVMLRFDAEQAAANLADLPGLLARANAAERRAVVRSIFEQVWVREKALSGLTPRVEVYPLMRSISRCVYGVADGYQVPLPQPLPSPAILYLSPQKPVLIPR